MHSYLALGFHDPSSTGTLEANRQDLLRYINLKLAAHGQPTVKSVGGAELVNLARGLLANFDEKTRLLEDYRCPADQRIENFLNHHFSDVLKAETLRLPGRTLILDRHGIARELSLPADQDVYSSDIVTSYRVKNGVLHNPRSDRRTTVGTFHIAAGGLPVAADKKEVPRPAFVELFRRAMQPPQSLLELPFTGGQSERAFGWVSLLLRPVVRPDVPGYCPELSLETRFFAPGNLVSNLDFVESIFGNAGDPYLPENDAALDVEHWTGHTGCVILATHLQGIRKVDVALPHYDQATERERRDGMCWKSDDELYNDGEAFKLVCRNEQGVEITIISDNYFGYCKKTIKCQISYSANLTGGVEEEHAGGAWVFPSFSLGDSFQANSRRYNGRTLDDVLSSYQDQIDIQPEGHGIDRHFPRLIYIPEDAQADLRKQTITFSRHGRNQSIPLLPERVYMAPSGYKLRIEKHPNAPSWRLIGTGGEGIYCHKPCTVSGGGKSEISKPIVDYMQFGSVFVADFPSDMQQVEKVFDHDYSRRWTPEAFQNQNYARYPSRGILSELRSLGSVIKLLTPSEEYNSEYNDWLRSIPGHIYALVFAIKRFHDPAWGNDWRSHFSVDTVNGDLGHELKLHDRKIVGSYLRVGLSGNHGWRTFKLRQDFAASSKIQTEDDISASVVVPRAALSLPLPDYMASQGASFKFITNCEYRLFQRPDDAIHRGLDRQAEADMARVGVNFISNFEPLTRAQVQEMREKAIDFDAFTPPMQQLLKSVDEDPDASFVVCSANPRRIGGVASKNPRYLQDRPDMADPFPKYAAEMGLRLFRGLGPDDPVYMPVNAVLSGRRNNPPDKAAGIRSLAVYGPIHFQELPELFMDYICSLTGKSPSTTGAGSEGALTKGPFNDLVPAADLNAALVAMILTGLHGFSSAAGHIGPEHRFDHDISLLVPEVWARLSPEERSPEFLLANRLLEPVPDLEWNGRHVPARRLGYRITNRFVRRYFGRVFDNPDKVFEEGILRPERQDLDAYADGILHIMEAYERTARQLLIDGTAAECCPPLQILLQIMAYGHFEGKDERDPEIRRLFTRESLLSSDWYQARLEAQRTHDAALWNRHAEVLLQAVEKDSHYDAEFRTQLQARQQLVAAQQEKIAAAGYLDSLIGTIGRQPLPSMSQPQSYTARGQC
ncbi:MAG: hypothetical protein ACK5Q5_21685 [Planctomycetaceae bacterium]